MTDTHQPGPEANLPSELPHLASPPVDVDESGTLAIGLMIAIIAIVALLTLALLISIP